MKEIKKPKTNNAHQGVLCTNVFKNQDTISSSLTSIWAEVINILENTEYMAHNSAVQSSTHPNLEKDEVRN